MWKCNLTYRVGSESGRTLQKGGDTMARRLEMIFSNQAGRRATISVDNVREDVTQQEVQSAMDTILDRGVFTTNGGDLLAIGSARIVATEITEISVEG